jgi:nitrate/nitrite transport system substrate-binding protein
VEASALVIAKEKDLFAKHGMPDVDVQKQASWGATRDNLTLGSERNGIDGAHILSPMPYLMTAGKVTQNNVPVPIYILARLNYDCQAISISNAYKDLKIGLDASPLKAAFEKKKSDLEAAVEAYTRQQLPSALQKWEDGLKLAELSQLQLQRTGDLADGTALC